MVDKSDKKNRLFLFNLVFYVGIVSYFLFGIISVIIILILVVFFFNRELGKNGHTIKDLFGSDGSKIRQEQVAIFEKKYTIEIGSPVKEQDLENIKNNKDTPEITPSQKEEIKNKMAYTMLKSVLNQQDKRGLFIMIKSTLVFFFIASVVTTLINSGGLGRDIGLGKMRDTLSTYITTSPSTNSPRIRIIIGIIVVLIIVKVVTDLKKAQSPKPLPEGKIEKPGI